MLSSRRDHSLLARRYITELTATAHICVNAFGVVSCDFRGSSRVQGEETIHENTRSDTKKIIER